MPNHFRCPYCLNAIRPKEVEKGSLKLYQCPDCSSELHRDYVTRNDIPSYSVGFIGFPGHGKTVYLTSLFYILGQMQNKWPGFFFKSLDDHSHDLLYNQVPEFGGNPGRLPAKTPTTFNAPALVLFNKIPDVGDCCISFYDISGETYTQSGAISDRGKFVAQANVVLLLMSLPSTDEKWATRSQAWTNEIQRMLDCYLHAVHNRMGLDLKERQNLIVVLTKADLLNANASFSSDFGTDLTDGSYEYYLNMLEASTAAGDISRRLKGWLQKNGAAGFINMAEGHFKSVSYTMVSATGGRTEGAVMTAPISPSDPKRVLDPLVKILEKEMKAREKIRKDLERNRADEELWKKSSSSDFRQKKAAYEKYIKEMPNGKYIDTAKRNLILIKLIPFITSASRIFAYIYLGYLIFFVIGCVVIGFSEKGKLHNVAFTLMEDEKAFFKYIPLRQTIGEVVMLRLATNGDPIAQVLMEEHLYSKVVMPLEKKQAALPPGKDLSDNDLKTLNNANESRFKWVRMAAEKGLAQAQNKLGVMYWDGKVVLQDYYVAVKLFRKAAEQNFHWGEFNLAEALYIGKGVSQDISEARVWYRKAADHGNEDAKKKILELGNS